jgi:sulfonate transport system substrate-binding protein
MMFGRKLQIALGLLALTALASPLQVAAKELRIAFQQYPAYSAVLVAKQNGWIEEEMAKVGEKDVTVKWVSFQSGPQVNEALGAGAVDVAAGIGDMPALLARASGMETKLIGLSSTGPDSEALMVRTDSPYQTVKDLKGKKVAAIRGGNLYQLLLLVLKDSGMTISDIEFINLSPQDMITALGNKSIDAATLFEPLMTRVETSGMARSIKTGRGLRSAMQPMVVSAAFAKENPKVVGAFLKAVRRGADDLRAHPKEWADRLAPAVGLTPAETAKAMSRFEWNPPIDAATMAELKRSLEFLVDNKFAKNSFDIGTFVDTSYGP